MRIVNDDTLKLFRNGPCDWCKRPVATDPHHAFVTKGAGGPDILCNLAAICRLCHTLIHTGEILDCSIWAQVAQREDALQGDIEAVVNMIRWQLPPNRFMHERRFLEAARKLNFGARRVAMREFELFRHVKGVFGMEEAA